ncbi:hypothetical protein Tco_0256542 [Tanacetum coccineum]
MEILPVSSSNSTAVGTNIGVAATFQQSHIHYHKLMLKLLSSNIQHYDNRYLTRMLSCNQRSLKSNKIREIVSLMKKRRLGAFKTNMSMSVKSTSSSRKLNQVDLRKGDDVGSRALKVKSRRLKIKITNHERTKPLQTRKDKDKTEEGKAQSQIKITSTSG